MIMLRTVSFHAMPGHGMEAPHVLHAPGIGHTNSVNPTLLIATM
ncbi:hypothetical protein [Azospirillum sp. BE72]|nr:hypothetical protein [Azospirillum sp. BE72]MDR6773528.1 hypothetical protein [Azospirillum sp. BE72]